MYILHYIFIGRSYGCSNRSVTLINAASKTLGMRVVNRDAEAVIPNVKPMTNVFQKFMGLRFKKEGRAFFSFHWPTRAALDMVFVRYPLDIAFIDEDMTILEIHGAFPLTLHPVTWRLYRPQEKYKHALEVEKGLLHEKGFKEGHTIEAIE